VSSSPAPQDTSTGGSHREIVVHVFGRTDVGRTREHNEDAFVVADLTTDNATLHPEVRTHISGPRGTLFMVADGMGGAAAGEIASSMAVEAVLEDMRSRWCKAPTADAEGFATALKRATEAANARIHRYASDHPENRGMGTTATVAGLLGDTLYVAQVGDSRAYVVRNGTAIQITKDQSLMQKLIEAGEITVEDAEHSDRRNIILQALGPEPTIKADLTHQMVRRGDTLILCSDGLSGLVKGNEIAAVVAAEPDLVAVCKRLIDLANSNGGPDNITVIAARFEGDGLEPAVTGDALGHRVFPLEGEANTPTIAVERFVRRSGSPTTKMKAQPAPAPAETPAVAAPNAEPPARSSRRGGGQLYLLAVAVVALAAAAWIAFRQLGPQ
jgi:protein phosphatase